MTPATVDDADILQVLLCCVQQLDGLSMLAQTVTEAWLQGEEGDSSSRDAPRGDEAV